MRELRKRTTVPLSVFNRRKNLAKSLNIPMSKSWELHDDIFAKLIKRHKTTSPRGKTTRLEFEVNYL